MTLNYDFKVDGSQVYSLQFAVWRCWGVYCFGFKAYDGVQVYLLLGVF